MKILKSIFLFAFIFNATIIFSQNKRGVLPSPQNLPPLPDFSWNNLCLGDTTCFINQTIRGNTYTWTITEDTIGILGLSVTKTLLTSNDTNICFHFYKPGTYSISLTAWNTHTVTDIKIITVDTITTAGFSYIQCSNVFANNSTCASAYLWNFGDGNSSIAFSPIHQYADTGHYLVRLIAYKGNISDTLKKTIFVDAIAFANAVFTHTVSHDTVFVHAVYSGPGTNYYWTWASGIYSTGRDTFHVYKDSTATYLVSLNVVNLICGPASKSDTVSIIKQIPPQADFSFINTCLGDTTCFINQSTGGLTYTWTVTGSSGHHTAILYTSANDSGFCFRFPAIGNYSVTLTANNLFYTISSTKIITIDTLPKANFYFMHCSNNFVNAATCSASFYWDFGDGAHSSLITPNHQYADTGYYQVTLIAYNGIFSDTLTKQIHVDVISFANGDFTTVISNDTLWVHAGYAGIPNAIYNWSFGDGSHATGKDTMHIYADTIFTYQVKLTVNNLCGSVFKTDTIQIIVPEPPSHLDFSNSILTVVPNPVSNSGYIDAFYNAYTPDNYLAQVYNALGQKMFEEYFSFQSGINEFKISTSGFSEGIYLLVLQSGNSFIRKKFYVVNKH